LQSFDNPLAYWLALIRVPGIGSRTFLRLLETHAPEQVFKEPVSALLALGLKEASLPAIKNPDWVAVERDLVWLGQAGHYAITINSPDYPRQLKEIADPPPVLFVYGNPSLMASPQIGMVGSRNPSTMGKETAFNFAKNLAECGFTITSGLALGIDAASHRGALAANGFTVAVAGTGLDRVYPASHKDLATQIIGNGALVSEFPLGTVAKANHFPRRNRIISGLSQGLLVVEAAIQSGSLITARLALEQNREVFAIPGSIHNPLARGCNALIREGAKLVETTQHIFEELPPYFQQDEKFIATDNQSMLDLEQQTLLNLIMFEPTRIDYLVAQTGSPVEEIASTLLILELQGYLETVPGGCYTRLK